MRLGDRVARPRLIAPETAIAISGALWGLYWIPIRHLQAGGLGVVWTTLGLFVAALALLVPVLVRHPPARAVLTPRMLVTGLLTGGAFVLYTVSIVLTEVVAAILLFYLSPVWATVLGRLLLGERFTASRLAALALGLGGLWVVLGSESGVPLPRNPGDWCALAAGVMWALGTLRVHQDAATSPAAHTASPLRRRHGGDCGHCPAAGHGRPGAGRHRSVRGDRHRHRGAERGERLEHPVGRGAPQPRPCGAAADDGGDHGLASAAALAGEPFAMAQVVGSMLIVAAVVVEVLPPAGRPRA